MPATHLFEISVEGLAPFSLPSKLTSRLTVLPSDRASEERFQLGGMLRQTLDRIQQTVQVSVFAVRAYDRGPKHTVNNQKRFYSIF